MTDAMLLTQAAYDRLRDELENLITVSRQEIAKRIQDAREEGDLKENGGYHAAKEEQGRIVEWPIVFLAGVNRGTFPSDHSRTDEQLAEERRLFYVAVTRAQIQLAVSYSSDKGPSPFVAI